MIPRFATIALLSGTMMLAWGWDLSRFTSGGSIYRPVPIYRVTFGCFRITQGATVVLDCTQYLEGGNNQAHRATGNLLRQ